METLPVPTIICNSKRVGGIRTSSPHDWTTDTANLTSHSWLLDTLPIPVFWMIVSEHSFLDVTQPPTAVAAFD